MECHKILYKNLQSKCDARDKNREQKNELWKNKRFEMFCGKRTRLRIHDIENDKITEEQIREAALQLKDKKAHRIQHLRMLTNGFSQGVDYINAYLEQDPSLTCLVGLLLGSDAEIIFLSAWCLTNMAAGTDKQASIIIKHASPYLIMFLSSHAPPIQDQCAWALGNLASTDVCRKDLFARGALKPLLLLLRSPSKNVIKSAMFAISNLLRSEFVQKNVVAPLLFEELSILINEYEDEDILSDCLWTLSFIALRIELKEDAITKFMEKLINILSFNIKMTKFNTHILTPLVRIIGNLICQLSQIDFHEMIKNSELFVVMECILHSDIIHLRKEAVWALSNMAVHCQLASAIVDHGIDETINILLRDKEVLDKVQFEDEGMDFDTFKI